MSSKSIEHRTLMPRGDALLRKTHLTRDTHGQSKPGITEGFSKGSFPGFHENGISFVIPTLPTPEADSPSFHLHRQQSKARITSCPRIVCLSAPGKDSAMINEMLDLVGK